MLGDLTRRIYVGCGLEDVVKGSSLWEYVWGYVVLEEWGMWP